MIDKLAYTLSKLNKSEVTELISVLMANHNIYLNMYSFNSSSINNDMSPVNGHIGNNTNDVQDYNNKYSVRILETGMRKLAVVKTINDTLRIGLKEAKWIADNAPCMVSVEMSRYNAETLKSDLEDCGAKAIIV